MPIKHLNSITVGESNAIDVKEIAWNPVDGTFNMGLLNDVVLQAGQEMHFYGKATEAISNGDAVMFAGAEGDHVLIAKATQAVINANPEYFIGVATQNFTTNQYGYVTSFGSVRDLDTTIYRIAPDSSEGNILYFDSAGTTPGALTITEPVAPNAKIRVAAVTRDNANVGVILVRPMVEPKLDQLQDMSIVGKTDGDVLVWNDTNKYWFNDSTLNVDYTNSRVGIGTTDPDYPLEVIGKSVSSDGFHKTSSQGVILSAGSGADTAVISNGWSSGTGDWMRLEVPSADDEGGVIQLNSNGRVGIGTNDPDSILHIKNSTAPELKLESSVTTYNTVSSKIGFYGGYDSNLELASIRVKELSSGGIGGGLSIFTTVDPDTPQEIITINSLGRVGIGTTGPSEKFHVSGNILATGTILGSNLSGTNTGDQDLSGYALTSHNHDGVYQPAGTYNTIIGTDLDIDTSGATIIDNIYVTDGVITSMGTRTLTLGDLGYTGATNANNYVHPAHPGDDINLDTGALTGATVISDLDFNITTDTLGHVTDANATYSTRNLTAADIGAAAASHNHDDRYYTESESDSRFVNVTGDTMTGSLRLQNDLNYFGLATTSNEAEIIINTGQAGSPQIGFTEHGDASWAIGIDDGDNSFKIHGTANAVIPTINNLATPIFELTTSGLGYFGTQRIFADNYHPNADTWTNSRTITIGNTGKSVNGSANVSWSLAEIGAQPAGTYNTIIGTDSDINTSGSTIIDNIYVTDGVITSMGTRTLTLGDLGYTGATNANYITNNNQLTNGAGYITFNDTSSNSNHLNSTRDTPDNSLQYWQASGLGTTEAPSTDWHNTIRMSHGDPLSYYSNTLAIRMTGSGIGDIYTQTIANGSAQGWKKHWNNGNDGSGSGLDADLLDGQHASAFATSSHNHDGDYVNVTGDTMTGRLTLNQNVTIGGTTPSNGNLVITDGSATLGIDSNELHSTTAMYIGTNSGNLTLRPAGDTLVTNGNVGIGTTSPASKLDVNGAAITRGNLGFINYASQSEAYYTKIGTQYNYNESFSIEHKTSKIMTFSDSNTFGLGLNGMGLIRFLDGGTERMRVHPGGNVGIGTTSPASKLQVVGDGAFNSTLVVQDPAVSSYGSLSLYHDSTGSSIHSNPASSNGSTVVLRLGINNSEKMRIANNGNVGIGTTSPSEKLDVAGNLLLNNSGEGWIKGYDNYHSIKFRVGGTNKTEYYEYGGTLAAGLGHKFFTGGTTGQTLKLQIADDGSYFSGNVGIGTTSPEASLDVDGAGNFSGGTVVAAIDTNTDVGVSIAKGDYLYSNDGAYLRKLIGQQTGGSIDIGQQGTGLISNINFFPGTSGNIDFFGSGSVDMRVSSAGNVGIGTTSPTAPLHVEGGTASEVLKIEANTNPYIRWVQNGTNVGFLQFTSGAAYLSNMSNGSFFIRTNNTDKMIITSTGHVGIGTTSPQAKLHVSNSGESNLDIEDTGGQRYRLFSRNSDKVFGMYDASNPKTWFRYTGNANTNSTKLALLEGGGNVGIGMTNPSYRLQLSVNSAAKPSSSTWTVVSDERVKENIKPYEKGLNEILQVNTKTFDYNGKAGFDKTKNNVGIIAQDMIKIFPETIKTYNAKLNETDEEETELYNFDGHALTFALINAIQELKAEIDELKKQINK